MKRVLIVEDAPAFQEAISDLLGQLDQSWQIFSFFDSRGAEEFLNRTPEPVDLALIDLGLPDGSGVDLIARLKAQWPDVPAVVISVYTSSEKVLPAIRAGAIGYLVKSDPDAIRVGIEQALLGEFPISPLVARHLIEVVSTTPDSENLAANSPLSRQEHRLLTHIANGLSYAEVAEVMSLSLSTIQTYSRNLFRKLDVHSKTQAIVKARQAGYLA